MTAEHMTATDPPDVQERHRARYQKAIDLAGRGGGTWWDVACGIGYGTAMMPGVVRVGFDRAQACVTEARTRVPRAAFWCADVTLPHWWIREGSRPNVILSVETIEHLASDAQGPFVRDLARVLRPAGCVVIACPIGDGPNPRNPWHLHEPSMGELMDLTACFPAVHIETEAYESTSGPATQAYAVCYAE